MLEVVRKNGMPDGPTDVHEPLRPGTGRNRALEFVPEFKETPPDPTPIPGIQPHPSDSADVEGLPVFLSIVAVADFRGVNDPWKPVAILWKAGGNMSADIRLQLFQVGIVQAVLKGEDWVLLGSVLSDLAEDPEMLQ